MLKKYESNRLCNVDNRLCTTFCELINDVTCVFICLIDYVASNEYSRTSKIKHKTRNQFASITTPPTTTHS